MSPWHDVPFWGRRGQDAQPPSADPGTRSNRNQRGQQARPGHEGPAALQVQRRGRTAISQTWETWPWPTRHGRRRRQRPPTCSSSTRCCARAAAATAAARGATPGRGGRDDQLLVVDADDSTTKRVAQWSRRPRDRGAPARPAPAQDGRGQGENEYGMGGRAIDGDGARASPSARRLGATRSAQGQVRLRRTACWCGGV